MIAIGSLDDSNQGGQNDRSRKMTGHLDVVIMTGFLMTVDWSLMTGHSRKLFFTHRNYGQAVIQSPIPPLGGRCNDDRMTSCSGRWEMTTVIYQQIYLTYTSHKGGLQ